MGGLRIELRRSPLPWWTLAMTVVGLGWLSAQSGDWDLVWPQAAAAAQATVVFLGPMAAAAAAYAAGRVHGNTAYDLTRGAARPTWQQSSLQLASTCLYVLVPYLLVVLVALAGPLSGGVSPGGPWPSYVLLGAIALMVCTGVGHATGRLVAGPAAPAAVAVAAFVGLGVLASDSPFNLTVISGPPHRELSTGAVAVRLLLAASVLFFAAVAARPAPRARAGRFWLLPGAAASVAVLSVLAMGQMGFPQVDRSPVAAVCSKGAAQVCVWPENEAHLDHTAKLARKVSTAAGQAVAVPERFYEHGLRPSDDGESSGFRLAVGDAGTMDGMISEIMPTAPDCRVTDAGIDRLAAAAPALEEWLFARALDEESDIPTVREVLHKPEKQQQRWAEERVEAITDAPCRR
ncbi:hypothetical protein [Streptomyces sp. NPDC087300]|uniref:DUF7224 domain-containing protein n=1 Tax=Streptomyces sp. NPDC087300 TaxID=3365780 RepID=UPI0038191A18